MTEGNRSDDPGARSPEEPTRALPRIDGPDAAYPNAQQPGGYQSGPGQPGPYGSAPPQSGRAAAFAGQSVRRMQSMPWQELVMRVPGALSVFAGLLALLSCLFSWWSIFDRSMGETLEYTVAPFRGVSASSGSRWSDMAALNSLSADDVEMASALTMYVGVLLVVAALSLVAGGLLVVLARAQVLGASLMLLGTVFLGYARIPAEVVGNFAEAASDVGSALTGPAEIFSGALSALIPEARIGLGLSTFALTIMTVALLVYLGMIIYRETIRIRRWMA